ncbi:MAG: isocitrate/isopropylmalate dehydrogenase family protein [Chloroflexi bacterium]|nr:isocitrate/isopropylmalate dehydrogenase family protein [Chloroflexota bacterium]
MSHTLCVIPGDGVGREVIPCAVEVLSKVIPDLALTEAEAGWDCFNRVGDALPDATKTKIAEAGAVLFGAVSSPSKKVAGYRSPIVHMRQLFDLYANLRPTKRVTASKPSPQPANGLSAIPTTQVLPDIQTPLAHLQSMQAGGAAAAQPAPAPIAPSASAQRLLDLLIVRENTQGLYIGREYMRGDVETGEAVAERVITKAASVRIGRVAFEMANARRKQLTIVHKANILGLTDGLFRDSVRSLSAEFPDVKINELLVDTAAMLLASRPHQFDVIVTTNLFGDILSDVASVWGGGMGVAPALNIGTKVAIAEPVHGSAPDIVGKGVANPAGAILSAALLCQYYWHLPGAAERIEQAVYSTLSQGICTPDLGGSASTNDILAAVLAAL